MPKTVPASEIDAALGQFGAAEANLKKLERIFAELNDLTPDDISFGSDPRYEDLCHDYEDILNALPRIDGWKPSARPIDLNAIAQWRLDAADIGEPEILVEAQERVEEPGRELRSYSRLLNKKRRQLIRDELSRSIAEVDQTLREIRTQIEDNAELQTSIQPEQWNKLKDRVTVIDTLLGSTLPRPKRWSDLERHLHFGQVVDLHDIIRNDWPIVKGGLIANLYHENEPVPVDADDLGALAATRPAGVISTKLQWDALTDEDFERLIFSLIGVTKGYENPQWLMRTNAPDKGRDISVDRVISDQLAGVTRQRVMVQCRHLGAKSINVTNIASLVQQMRLWDSPRVDVLVIATTGRFTEQAVSSVEKANNEDRALRVEMWPESHLERLLAKHPALIAQFNLR